MIEGPPSQARDMVSFGPFGLVPNERLLTKDGVAVELCARTLDTLIALVARPNQIVAKTDLLARIWPDVIVEEGSLRLHIAGLRKAPVSVSTVAPRRIEAAAAPVFQNGHALPARLERMQGRADGLAALAEQLATCRFVTIVGPGRVGKTTVGVAVAHDLLEAFAGAAVFVDLAMQSDPDMVPAALA